MFFSFISNFCLDFQSSKQSLIVQVLLFNSFIIKGIFSILLVQYVILLGTSSKNISISVIWLPSLTLLKLIYSKFWHPLNKFDKEVVFDKSKFDKSKYFKFSQPENNPKTISNESVLNFDKSIEVNDKQSENIKFIVSTEEVSKLDKSTDVKEVHE